MTFKRIPQYPDFEISRDGAVRVFKPTLEKYGSLTPLIPRAIHAAHEVVHLCVEIDNQIVPCWTLMFSAFHNSGVAQWPTNPLLLPRDGNFLNLKEDNLFPFEVSTNCRIRYASDIHGVWRAAMVEQVPCNKMAERLNLPQYGAHEFRVLIGEILLAGIR